MSSKLHIKTVTISSKNEIPISPEVLKSLELAEGDSLLEFFVDGYLIYVPANKILSTLTGRAEIILNNAGIDLKALKATVETKKSLKKVHDNDDIGIPIIVSLCAQPGQEY